MPFRNRRALRMRPVNSQKHIVDLQGTTVMGTNQFTILINTVENAVLANSADVEKGSNVSSIYLNIQAVGQGASGVLNNIYMYVFKNPAGLITTFPDGNQTGISEFKKQIFHTEMRMLSDDNDSIPVTIFQGVLRIPQKFQRMGIDDTIGVVLFSPGPTANFCIECIYKEFR